MNDSNEPKKFIYDTELSTTHTVLTANYDEQLRAVLNYSPALKIRVLEGVNVCPTGTKPKRGKP